MVLGEAAVWRPHQAADRQIEPRRAILALVVAVRREIQGFKPFRTVTQGVNRGAVRQPANASSDQGESEGPTDRDSLLAAALGVESVDSPILHRRAERAEPTVP